MPPQSISDVAFPPHRFADWLAKVDKDLKGKPYEKLIRKTLDGVELKPLYTRADGDVSGTLGSERRGSARALHGADWDLRVRYRDPDLAANRQQLQRDLSRGVRSLWLVFDARLRRGADASGAGGLCCGDLSDLERLLTGVDLSETAISMDAGAQGTLAAALLLAVAERRGLPLRALRGSVDGDPLGALASDGALPYSMDTAEELSCGLAQDLSMRAPGVRAMLASGLPYHEAGANHVQELAYVLATGVTYLRWLTGAGLSISEACAQLSFRMAVGTDFFTEMAKLRAFRACWAKVVSACGGTSDDGVCVLHAVESERDKTLRDPWVNMLRTTTEAFSAAVAGADAITTEGFDGLHGRSHELARRVASNTQVILNEEAHVTQVADPAGGSWYVESLTGELAKAAWAHLQLLEAEGGMAQALQSGLVAEQVTATSKARDKLVARRRQGITGVSEFANVAEPGLQRARPEQDTAVPGAEPHAALREAMVSGEGALGAALDALLQDVPLRSLAVALGDPGAAASIAALPPRRTAREFEELRQASDRQLERTGKRPIALLANMGEIPRHKARASFAAGFLHAGGLEVMDNDGFADPAAAASAYGQSGASVAVLCGDDKQYAESGKAMAMALKRAGARHILLAGRPGELEGALRGAGVTGFIYVGCDLVGTISALYRQLGVRS